MPEQDNNLDESAKQNTTTQGFSEYFRIFLRGRLAYVCPYLSPNDVKFPYNTDAVAVYNCIAKIVFLVNPHMTGILCAHNFIDPQFHNFSLIFNGGKKKIKKIDI